MKFDYEVKHLEEIVEVKGRIGWKGYKTSDLTNYGPVVIGGNNVKNRLYLDFSEKKHLSEEKFLESPEIALNNSDIIIVCRGNGVGDVGFFQGEFSRATINPSVVILSKCKVNPKYLFYYLTSKEGQSTLHSMVSGSSIPAIYQSTIRKMDIKVPNEKIQNYTANILSSLDDKIELNIKINKNLEELAQTIYKSWFVDFEFPNEKGVPYKSSGGMMIESELGWIPMGWIVEQLGNSSITKLISSGINHFTGFKKYIATADVSESAITSFETNISYLDRPSRANMQPIKNSLWFAKMKDSRKLIRVSKSSNYLIQRCIFSTGFAGIESKEAMNYIWTLLTTTEFEYAKSNLCNGTTMQSIKNENINRIKVVIPEKNILRKYETFSDSIFERIHINEIENTKLSKIRDELLSKLMNGELEVPIEE